MPSSFCLSHGTSSPLFPLVKKNNNNLQIYFSGNLEETLLGEKKKKKASKHKAHKDSNTLPTPPIFFLWCIHFSKVTSEAFPSWLLKQTTTTTKNACPKKHMKPSLWLGLLPCVQMPREKKQSRRGGVCWYFSKTFSLTRGGGWRWSDEWGSICPAAWVTQQQFPIHFFFFFSFHYRIWCHLFLPPPQKKK